MTGSQFTPQNIRAVMRSLDGAIPAIRFVESLHMVDLVEDWSRCRSRSRAERRRKQGHRQNVLTIRTPKKEAIVINGVIYLHPVMMAEVRKAMEASHDHQG